MIDLGTYLSGATAAAGPQLIAEDQHMRLELNEPWFRAYVNGQLGFRTKARSAPPTGRAKVGASELSRHAMICGSTGSGKSRLLEHLLDQQLRAGCSVVLIDPKGETADHVLARVAVGGLEPHRVTILDPNRSLGTPAWNPLCSGVPLSQAVGDIVALLEQSSTSWGPRLQDLLTNTLLIVGAHELSLYEATRFLVREDYRARLLRSEPPRNGGMAYSEARHYFAEEFRAWTRGERANAVTPVLNKVREILRSDFLRPLLCARRNSLDLRRLWHRSGLVVVRLDRTALGEEGARLLSGLLAHLLFRTALRSSGPVPVVLAIDELPMLERFIGKPLAEILAVARSQRLRLMVSCQHLAQLSDPLRASLLANAAVQAFFRVGPVDARLVGASLATEEPPTSWGQVNVRADRIDRATGRPEQATWSHVIRDAYGKPLRHAGLPTPCFGAIGLEMVTQQALDAGIPRLYVHAADSAEPVALSQYVSRLDSTRYWFEGPVLRLVVSFPRPRLRIGRTGEHEAVRRWAGTLQELPVQHAALRLAGNQTGIVRVADVPVPHVNYRSYREWLRAAQRANGQTVAEQQETLAWRQAGIDGKASSSALRTANEAEVDDGSLA